MELDRILLKMKALSGIEEGEYDTKLSIVIGMMIDEVKIFCNIGPSSTIPKEMENIIVQMVIDYLKINPMDIKNFEGNNLKSIQRGDTTITYNISEITVNMVEFIKGYHTRLVPFSRLKMR